MHNWTDSVFITLFVVTDCVRILCIHVHGNILFKYCWDVLKIQIPGYLLYFEFT